ncbi:hypothetical protein LZQ00_06280 [Sphingobacterium sp. SRCM116780]|uniref:hypothetical protein n=1 Tax=Sphingobacterium sp. SRCM116780 TaxID=2907623 RepID=UPI001F172DBC|nr:hypothetical protein [Sphingobacterium sp. SRCM116780]UIR57421.1 hypothetical protein LZQ00_06280 [Sphingobacterium sp. SRCM116780]
MKKFFWIICILILIVIGYFIYDNQVAFKKIYNYVFNKHVSLYDDQEIPLTTSPNLQETLRFAGQNIHYVGQFHDDTVHYAYLIKGALLDPKLEAYYKQIPDTLNLGFGEQVYLVGNEKFNYDSNDLFVDFPKDEVDTVAYTATTDETMAKRMYARMVYEGKAKGMRIYPAKFSTTKYLYKTDDFINKYHIFNTGRNHFFITELDYNIKEVVLQFVHSEEGKNFRLPDDERTYKEIIQLDNFTGTDREEAAIVLQDELASKKGENRDALLVIAYNPQQNNYYLLHKAVFDSKIIITTTNEEHDDKNLGCTSLLLKVPNRRDLIMTYDKEFDEMKGVDTP